MVKNSHNIQMQVLYVCEDHRDSQAYISVCSFLCACVKCAHILRLRNRCTCVIQRMLMYGLCAVIRVYTQIFLHGMHACMQYTLDACKGYPHPKNNTFIVYMNMIVYMLIYTIITTYQSEGYSGN